MSKRDLFLPPPSIIAARRRKDQNIRPTPPPKQPVRDDLQLIRPDQGLLPIAKPDENPEKPILKGILGTENSQVIIVRYQNKSYLLKLGEILPGTKYRVSEINNDSVILTTPKGRVKLEKKERAK
jgi:type II secretory pathway component PulC